MEDPIVDPPANGVPEAVEAVEEAVELTPEPDAPTAAEPQEPARIRQIYILRLPRPEQTKEEEAIAKLQLDLRAFVTKIKAVVVKRQALRNEVAEHRRQVNEAHSLRDVSSPEFDEKRRRVKELRDARSEALNQISAIRAAGQALEARSEAELDARIRECEDRIASGALQLREEKALVASIAKLRAQRERVAAYEAQAAAIPGLQAEANKMRDLIAGMKGEVDLLFGERSQVTEILDELRAKLKAGVEKLKAMDGELAELEAKKQGVAAALDAARDALDQALQGWRENRKQSMSLRDRVEAGDAEGAAADAAAQVEAGLGRLLGDPLAWKDYVTAWAGQRKYIVSDLLPNSGQPPPPPGGAPPGGDARGGRQPRGGPGGPPRGGANGAAPAAAPAPPLQPQGAAKARAIIDQLLQATARKPEPVPEPEEAPDAGDAVLANGDAPAPPPKPFVPGASEEVLAAPPPRPKAHKPAHDIARVLAELPAVDAAYGGEFVPPPLAPTSAPLSEAERKAQVREENRLKAAEAVERKKRRLETAAKKRAVKAEQARTAPEPSPPARPADAAPAAANGLDAGVASGEDGGADASVVAAVTPFAPAASQQQRGGGGGKRGGKGGKAVKPPPQSVVAPVSARKPRAAKEAKLHKRVIKWAEAHPWELGGALALVVLLLVALVVGLQGSAPAALPVGAAA